MGKTLYQMGYYAGALNYFERIADAGATHGYYNATLKWLAALSRVLPETSGILEKIGVRSGPLTSRSWRGPRRALLLARPLLPQGQFDEPSTCSAGSDQARRCARRLRGRHHVRKYEAGHAEAFKEIRSS
jgi:hypothetical protein